MEMVVGINPEKYHSRPNGEGLLWRVLPAQFIVGSSLCPLVEQISSQQEEALIGTLGTSR